MAVYSRNTASNISSSSNIGPSIPSMDLGSIIVKSLETSLKDVDTDSENLSQSITDGINKSVLGKKDDSKNTAATILKAEQEIQKIKKKNEEDDDKRKKSFFKKMFDSYNSLFKNFESNLKGGFEKTFSSLSTFTENPLMGFDKGLQSVIKGALGTVDKIANAPLPSLKKKNKDKDAQEGELSSGSSLIGSQLNQIAASTQSNLLISQQQNKNELKHNKDIEKETKDNRKEDKKEGAIKEKKRSEDSEKINQGIGKTNLTLGSLVGKIAGIAIGIVAIGSILPILLGKGAELVLLVKEKIAGFISMIPTYFQNLMNTFGTVIENLLIDLKQAFMPIIQKVGGALIKFTMIGKSEDEKNKALAEFYGVSDKEYAEYERNKKTADAYSEYKSAQSELPALLEQREQAKADWEAYKKEHPRSLFKSEAQRRYETLDKKISLKQGTIAQFEKKKYTINGQEYYGSQITEEMLGSSAETAAKIQGNVAMSKEQAKAQKQANWDKTNAENEARMLEGQFDFFLKDLTESQKQHFLETNTWTTSKRGKGKTYQLTPGQRERLINAPTREIGFLEKVEGAGGFVGTKLTNVGEQLHHDLHVDALDGFDAGKAHSAEVQKNDYNTMYVNNTFNSRTMSGK